MRKYLYLFILLLLMAVGSSACHEETKVDIAHSLNPEGMPTMSTRNISTLISDSGVTQYKIISPLWLIYDEANPPVWKFPEGLYLQKFDRFFNVIATVAADSAVYFKNDKLWRLDGHVEMTKKPKDLFLSPRLFWDQRAQTLYSDTFIHIENETHILEGTGFISDEKLADYRILYPTGIFPIDKDDLKGGQGVQTTPPGQPSSPVMTPPPPMAAPTGEQTPVGTADTPERPVAVKIVDEDN